MTGQYLYHTYPYPFRIAVIKMGYFAGGQYYEYEADQFVSKDTLEIYSMLLFQREEQPKIKHNCKSCAKVCRNLTVYESCCDYEPMEGLMSCQT